MSGELYDPVANPYAPGAGTPPPALVGRDEVIDIADVALRRLRSARASQHMLITGLRGVGKTVLLGKLAALAEHVGYRVIRVEALDSDDTIRSLLRQARRIVEEFDSGARVGRALRSIESVSLTVAGTGVAIEREALELYRLSWDLTEIALFTDDFRRPHEADDDTRTAWEGLQRHLDPTRWR